MQDRETVLETLRTQLGDADLIVLLEQAAGTRVYVSKSDKLAERFGDELAAKLHERYAREYLKVPLGRAFRAEHYAEKGYSNGQIARLLGITEGGVESMLRRIARERAGRRDGEPKA